VPNLAKFTINASASSPGGFSATVSQVLTMALEGGPANVVNRWTLQVFDAADASSPLASKNAPSLTLVGGTSGQKVDAATPGTSITTTMPSSGVHSWLVRSLVNGGLNAKGKADPEYVYERLVYIPTGSALRKVIATEGTAASSRGWADAQNDLIDAGAGPLTAPGGASDANKVAQANGSGTNLGYAATLRIDNNYFTLDVAASQGGFYQQTSAAATDTARRLMEFAAQNVSGNTNTIGGTVFVRGGDTFGSGGTHQGGDAILRGGWANGASGTRRGGHVVLGGGTGATSYGNIYFGTDYAAGYDFKSMARGIVVQNALAAPTADLSDAHAYYSDTGRPTWRFNGTTLRLDGTSGSASAGGLAKPSLYDGYITVTIGGSTKKIPFYAN
jgi:hypothetical protein